MRRKAHPAPAARRAAPATGSNVFPGLRRLLLFALICLSMPAPDALALGQAQYVETAWRQGGFPIVQKGAAAPIAVDSGDFAGVLRAAGDLQNDIFRVTGIRPEVARGISHPGLRTILIGTLGKSRIIDRLRREGKIDASGIEGKWESFFVQVVSKPMPGTDAALVICGSDKRGTIYGIYDLSEQIGVSPWHFWTDTPPRHHDELFVRPGRFQQGPPAVKYRGIFLNDEAPDLTGWAREKFGGYNHAFYTNIFELLLRLKANYLWPAMWDNCFSEDDPLNPKLADEYGIVMGTSHVEPMMRADKEWVRAGYRASEWNYATHPTLVSNFWRQGIVRNDHYESIVTVGMRGKTDSPMAGVGNLAGNIALLQKIVADQRSTLADVLHTDPVDVPQVWTLYKEVQGYYERGLRVPDDVTLLWSDDNWGDIRRLPTPSERGRRGGAGIYYHLDYVGGPRNYKWVNTVPITKIWEQMHQACRYGANRIWIVNVGHLQHVTYPTEFFLDYAWDPDRWPREKLSEFGRLWAQREFGPALAPQIAGLVARYTKYNARCKPELLAPGTFSLIHYREAGRVLSDWRAMAAQADAIQRKLPPDERDTFFETVLYPVKACENLNALYIAAARNRLYASQGRAQANGCAAQVRRLFLTDARLSDDYNHKLGGGRWNHMMDQTHIGYRGWQQPESNSMPAVAELPISGPGRMGVAVEGSVHAWPAFAGEAVLPSFDKFNRLRHYIDLFNQGRSPFRFSARSGEPWIVLSETNGSVKTARRLWVGVDWKSAPAGSCEGSVRIRSGTNAVVVKVSAFNPAEPTRTDLKGFVEAGGCVSIEAEHCTGNIAAPGARWEKIPDYGNTLSAMTIFPVTAKSVLPPADSPCLQYRMYLFSTGAVQVASIVAPTLNIAPDRGLRFAVSFDDEPPQLVTAVPKGFFVDNGNRDWEESVKHNCRWLISTHRIDRAGYHTLKVWMVDPGLVLEKIVVNTGGVEPSYLGPPESFYRN